MPHQDEKFAKFVVRRVKAFSGLIWFVVLCLSCNGMGRRAPAIAVRNTNNVAVKPLSFSAQSVARFETFWERLHQRTHYTGATLITYNDSVYLWSRGLADSAKELSPDMPMQIASISKTFCASAVMILHSKGKLKLTDSLRQFFPELPYYYITVEHLLSHGSGLPEYTWFTDKLWHDSLGQINNQQLITLMAHDKPQAYFKPGRHHRYCNTNFVLLASIIEKVSGMSYPAFLKENIFQPLEMKKTFVLPANYHVKDCPVKGHYGDGREFEEHYQDGTYGDKNIISTVNDLYLFYKGLRNNKLFSEELKNEMFRVRWPNARRGTGYALGWRVRVVDDEVWMFHSGWWHGFRTNFYFSLKEDKCAVTLCNRLSGGFIPGPTIVSLFKETDWNAHVSHWHRGERKLLESED